ncbi:MAG: ABC-F family ATP-binding cassette domain-containing protein [Deltaproteobacteria bacterium]|nr:ABC-F family ATP-binding cassette domain-containing protein [Deltaproteobacteria bacterium]
MIFITNIGIQHGSQIVFKNASFKILEGDRIGIVGANGAGKSTVFRLINGDETPDYGEISKSKKTVIGYFSQETGDMKGRSALAEVMAVAEDVTRLGIEIKEMEHAMSTPLNDDEMADLLVRYGDAVESFEHQGGYDLESRAQAVLTGLGIGPDDYNRQVETFSGGWKMRIALARILTLNPDVLLLDEPTNHLDIESIIWLENWLSTEFKGALAMTSHDREFLNRSIKTVAVVENMTITTYSGNFDFYLEQSSIRREQLLASHKRQQDMMAKDEAFIAKFKARVSHAAQVQSRVKKLEKIEKIEIPPDQKRVKFEFPNPPRSGDDVLRLEDLGKVWRDENGDKSVFGGLNGLVKRGEKVAITGINGAGKSTLLKVIASKTEPTTGTMTLGANISIGYFSQHAMDILSPDKTVFETVYEALPEASIGSVRSLCGAFLFRGDEADKKISALSGGEKSRVVLATILARPHNFLIFDEPTNHLDMESREILLEALINFQGTVLIVSHDRHFLKSLATRVFEIDHGNMNIFEGSYTYYLDKTEHPEVNPSNS